MTLITQILQVAAPLRLRTLNFYCFTQKSAENAENARAALVLTIRGVFSHPLRSSEELK